MTPHDPVATFEESYARVRAGQMPALDGVRGVACLLVMLYHMNCYWLVKTDVDAAIASVAAFGWAGVDVFFVLSGFLITSILLRQRGSPHYYRAFYGRRVLRILPLYYTCLVLYLYVVPWLTQAPEAFWHPGSSQSSIWYWVFLSNFHNAFTGSLQHSFLQVMWSVAIEEQFYLFWPLLVVALSRARLASVCVALLIGALGLRAWAVLFTDLPALFAFTFTFCRIDALAAGALVAVWALDPAARSRMVALAPRVGWAAGGTVVAIATWLRLHPDSPLMGRGTTVFADELRPFLGYMLSPLWLTLGLSLTALVVASLLVHVHAAPRALAGRALSSRPLRVLGKYSYALYLLHTFGAELSRSIFDPLAWKGSYLAGQAMHWFFGISTSFALALVSWHVIEKPFQRLRRFFPYEAPELRAERG